MSKPPFSIETSGCAREHETAPRFECRVRARGHMLLAWVHAVGEVDFVTAPELDLLLRRTEQYAQLVVLDLREVSFMDSAGLRVVVDRSSQAQSLERRIVVIVHASSQVHRLVKLTELAGQLNIIDDPSAALIRARTPLSAENREAPASSPSPHDTRTSTLSATSRLRSDERPGPSAA